MLSKEEIQDLKQQLSDQIKNLPLEKKAAAQAQIDSMSAEALETMLKQQTNKAPQEILRSIVSGEIPSRKIDESPEAIAVLEIKPLSKAHILVIPKKKVTNGELPKPISKFANKIAKRVTIKYKPQGVEIIPESKFGEQVLNIVPYYKDKVTLQSARYDASDKELDEIYTRLKKVPRKEVIRQKKPKSTTAIVLKRKIP